MRRVMASAQNGWLFVLGLVTGFVISYLFMNEATLVFSASPVLVRQNNDKTLRVFATNTNATSTGGKENEGQRGGGGMYDAEQSLGHHALPRPVKAADIEAANKRFLDTQARAVIDAQSDAHQHADDDHTVARSLYDSVRVLVWVMTQPENLESKARHVNMTWGRRANKILYASDGYDPKFPTIPIEIEHGRDHLTAKTMASFDYVFEHYRDDYDWFMKADDDTYVIMENLRYFLSNEDTEQPVFFGHWFKVIVQQGYYSGGGGYVLSREALRRFGARDKDACQKDQGAEDVAFGACMQTLGVKTKESVDSLGRSRFHCFNPETHRRGGFPDWYYQYDKYDAKQVGVTGMSDYPITFHYCSIEVMYDLEYYVYHLKPYGIKSGLQDLNIHRDVTVSPSNNTSDVGSEAKRREGEQGEAREQHVEEQAKDTGQSEGHGQGQGAQYGQGTNQGQGSDQDQGHSKVKGHNKVKEMIKVKGHSKFMDQNNAKLLRSRTKRPTKL